MPEGPFGFPRLTSIGPFVSSGDNNLYHFTEPEHLESILEYGFDSGYDKALEDAGGYRMGSIQSNMLLELAVDYSKPDNKFHLPNRFESSFFFNDKERAADILRSGTSKVALEVNPDKIPCDGAVGSYEEAKEVNQLFYDEVIHKDSDAIVSSVEPEIDGDKLPKKFLSRAEKYWDGVKLYTGQSGREMEVWFDCHIPPDSIERIINIDS